MRGYWHGPSLQEALINEEEEGGRGEKKELFIHSWYIYIYGNTDVKRTAHRDI